MVGLYAYPLTSMHICEIIEVGKSNLLGVAAERSQILL